MEETYSLFFDKPTIKLQSKPGVWQSFVLPNIHEASLTGIREEAFKYKAFSTFGESSDYLKRLIDLPVLATPVTDETFTITPPRISWTRALHPRHLYFTPSSAVLVDEKLAMVNFKIETEDSDYTNPLANLVEVDFSDVWNITPETFSDDSGIHLLDSKKTGYFWM